MKFKLPIIPICFCMMLIMLLRCTSPEIVKEQNTLKPYECIAITELREMVESKNIVKPQVNIRGIVTEKFICPPCPEGYDCEQCPEDHIVISDGKTGITIGCRPEHFEENQEYCLSLEVKKNIDGFPFSITGWEKNPGKKCRPGKPE